MSNNIRIGGKEYSHTITDITQLTQDNGIWENAKFAGYVHVKSKDWWLWMVSEDGKMWRPIREHADDLRLCFEEGIINE